MVYHVVLSFLIFLAEIVFSNSLSITRRSMLTTTSLPFLLSTPTIKLDPKDNLPWNSEGDTVNWNEIRYGISTLQGSRVPVGASAARFPLDGYYLTTSKFEKAVFPQGRGNISLKLAGAGLGTCIALPNVGKSPFPFPQRFIDGYEDMAYNYPRKFEAFWPQAKVQAVQVASKEGSLTPKCFVDGTNCSESENPRLHSPSSRIVMEYKGPTRSGPDRTQSCDTSIIASTEYNEDGRYRCVRNFSQFNVEQSLQTFFKETVQISSEGTGKIQVGAFLPLGESSTTSSYDDTKALAIYTYSIVFSPVSVEDAARI